MGLEFDDRFGLSGGSDTMLTHSIVKLGGQLRWCDEAEVYDYNSADRLTHRWVLRRFFRTGNVWSRVKLALADAGPRRALVRLHLLFKALLRVARGMVQLIAGLARSDVGLRASGICLLSSALGSATGALGLVSVEYRRARRSAVEQERTTPDLANWSDPSDEL
jgi:hypothetical protein